MSCYAKKPALSLGIYNIGRMSSRIQHRISASFIFSEAPRSPIFDRCLGTWRRRWSGFTCGLLRLDGALMISPRAPKGRRIAGVAASGGSSRRAVRIWRCEPGIYRTCCRSGSPRRWRRSQLPRRRRDPRGARWLKQHPPHKSFKTSYIDEAGGEAHPKQPRRVDQCQSTGAGVWRLLTPP
jgi:hypothetical protein